VALIDTVRNMDRIKVTSHDVPLIDAGKRLIRYSALRGRQRLKINYPRIPQGRNPTHYLLAQFVRSRILLEPYGIARTADELHPTQARMLIVRQRCRIDCRPLIIRIDIRLFAASVFSYFRSNKKMPHLIRSCIRLAPVMTTPARMKATQKEEPRGRRSITDSAWIGSFLIFLALPPVASPR
jgi:hypothetical protein